MWYFHEVIDTIQTFRRGLFSSRGKRKKIWFGGGKHCHCCYIIQYKFPDNTILEKDKY